MIVNLIAGLAGQLIGLFGERGKKAQEILSARVSQMERSWTDEFIVVTWFSPVWVAWFSEQRAIGWINLVQNLPGEYWVMLQGITLAVFGLGKLNGRKK